MQEVRPDEQLTAAAADILRKSGIKGLTFRSVASQAERTLGSTSYYFGSKEQLLSLAVEALYRTVACDAERSDQRGKDGISLKSVVNGVVNRTEPVLSAFDEIIAHIGRSDGYHPLRGIIRAYRDPLAARILDSLLGDERNAPTSLAAAFSSICRGMNHLTLSKDNGSARAWGTRAMVRFLDRRPVP